MGVSPLFGMVAHTSSDVAGGGAGAVVGGGAGAVVFAGAGAVVGAGAGAVVGAGAGALVGAGLGAVVTAAGVVTAGVVVADVPQPIMTMEQIIITPRMILSFFTSSPLLSYFLARTWLILILYHIR